MDVFQMSEYVFSHIIKLHHSKKNKTKQKQANKKNIWDVEPDFERII